MATRDQTINTPIPATREASEGKNNRLALALALVSLYLIWGSTYLGIRIAIETFPPFMMGAIRFLIAGAVLYAYLRLRGHANPTRRQWGGAAIVGALLLVGGNGAVIFAEQEISSGLAALMIATTPLFAALFSGLWGQWPRRLEWGGIALGLVGVAMLTMESDLQANPIGTAALIIATISWSFGSIWSRRLPMPTGLMASAAEMLAGGALFLVISLSLGETFKGAPSVASISALVYLIIFGSLVAFSAYLYLLSNVRPALATSYAYVNPVVAVILGVGFAGEQITWFGVVGMLVILTGVASMSLVRSSGPKGTKPLQSSK
ncbi:MAG TPA: drug/metabolite exporter YedA [Chloroflexia bacterium]|jgi:drug/metabolite transporter (DMT)-like permease